MRALRLTAVLLALSVVTFAQVPSVISVLSIIDTPAASWGMGCAGPCHGRTQFSYAQVGTVDRIGWNATFNAQTINGLNVTSHGNNAPTHAMIIDAANAPGSVGKAFRHTRTPTTMSGGLKFVFASLTDVSVSFRMRYSPGFMYSGSGGAPGFTKENYGNGIIIYGHQGGAWGVNVGGSVNYPGSLNWTGLYGTNGSDGQYHCHEYRLNFVARTMEVWVNGTKTLNRTNVDFRGTTAWDNFFVSNQSAVTVGEYTDYDDFRIDTGLPTGAQMGCGPLRADE